MTRLLQTHSWLQTSNGWKEEFDPPPILQQNMVDVTMNNNTISFPIFCQSIQQSHPVGIFNGGNPLAHSFSLIMFNLILNTLITRSLQVLLKPLKQPVIISQIIVSRFLHLVILKPLWEWEAKPALLGTWQPTILDVISLPIYLIILHFHDPFLFLILLLVAWSPIYMISFRGSIGKRYFLIELGNGI